MQELLFQRGQAGSNTEDLFGEPTERTPMAEDVRALVRSYERDIPSSPKPLLVAMALWDARNDLSEEVFTQVILRMIDAAYARGTKDTVAAALT